MLMDKVCQQEKSLPKLEQMNKSIHMFNSSITTLERILEMGKRSKDHGGLGLKGENLGNNILTEETQNGKDCHHGRKTYLSALKYYYYRKWGHIKKECSHFLMRQEMRQQVQPQS